MADDFRLSHAPVVEALVELQFNKTADFLAYGPIPGQMYERLKNDYPEAIDLDAAALPLGFETPLPLVRHRFTSADGERLFQVGNGIVSCNALRYQTYAVFRAQAEPVVQTAFAVFGQPIRAVLRYINKIPTGGRPMSEILRVGLRLPEEMQWLRQQAVCARKIEGTGEFQMTWATPVDGNSELVLFDLQLTSAILPETTSTDELLRWMDAAHDEIEGAFLGNLVPEFLETIK